MKVLHIDLWKCYLSYVRENKGKLPNYKYVVSLVVGEVDSFFLALKGVPGDRLRTRAVESQLLSGNSIWGQFL